jgi:hypothetical protein
MSCTQKIPLVGMGAHRAWVFALAVLAAGCPGGNGDGSSGEDDDARKDSGAGAGPDTSDARVSAIEGGTKDSGAPQDSHAASDGTPGRDVGSVADGVAPSGLSATVTIPGHPVSFNPTLVVASNRGVYTGQRQLNDVVGIYAAEGGASFDTLTILFDRNQIQGPGTFTLGPADEVFDNEMMEAALMFSSPDIDNDDRSPVVFAATSGTAILVRWGTAVGDRLSGTVNAAISGARTTGWDANGSPITEELSGNVTVVFDVVIVPDP